MTASPGGNTPRLSLVVAMADNRVIGQQGGLPWHLPADLKRFKALTMGKPLVMGRKTFESIGRVLPGRPHVVITRTPGYAVPEGVDVVASLLEALARAHALAIRWKAHEIAVIGGGEIFAEALPLADRIYLTEVHAEIEGDTWFPELDPAEWHERLRERLQEADGDQPALDFVILERVPDEAPGGTGGTP